MTKLKCKKCNYSWKPKTKSPQCCPYCKSYKWNVKDKRANNALNLLK